MLGWEFFYRGFMTIGLKDSLKEGAILVQMVPFTILHLGKPMAESIACIPSGLIWGYICYKSDSFWPAVIMHMAVNVLLKCGSMGML
jgi:membrane protease YdiL (CAAX protease family)